MRRLPVVSPVSALVAILLAVPAGARAAGQAPAGPVQEPLAIGSGGAVASMDADASQAGIAVLHHGGNAADAAVAVAGALGVTEPFVAGPGGGGFMVIYLAKPHQVVTIDGRESCPAACTRRFSSIRRRASRSTSTTPRISRWRSACPSWWPRGPRRPAVRAPAPGRRPPAGHRGAERGFLVDQAFVQQTQSDLLGLQATRRGGLCCSPSGRRSRSARCSATRTWPRPTGCLPGTGTGCLYDGPIGEASSRPRDHPVLTPGQTVVQLPGIVTRSDLRAYRPGFWRPLTCATAVWTSTAWRRRRGGSTVGEALNILSGYDLSPSAR